MAAYKAPKIGKEKFFTRKTNYGINHDPFGTQLNVQTGRTGSITLQKGGGFSPEHSVDYGIKVFKNF